MVVGLLFMARMLMPVGPVCIHDMVVIVHVRSVAVCMGMAVLMVVSMGMGVIVLMAVDHVAMSMFMLMMMRMLVDVFVLMFVLAFHGALLSQLVLNWAGPKWRPPVWAFV